MMKNMLFILGFLFLGLQDMSALASSRKAVEGVMERTIGHLPTNVKWSIHPDRARLPFQTASQRTGAAE